MNGAAILCVDDELLVLRTTELVLQNAGYVVSTAATVGDACRLVKSQHFDLLLLDCIPGRGWVVQEANRANPNMRVVICSGDISISDFRLVDMVIHKPISPASLLRSIAEMLSTSKAA